MEFNDLLLVIYFERVKSVFIITVLNIDFEESPELAELFFDGKKRVQKIPHRLFRRGQF